MITIIRLETSDQQRQDLARFLGIKGMVSRNDVTNLVQGCVDAALESSTRAPQKTTADTSLGKGMTRIEYFSALETHLRNQGNYQGAAIAARTVQELAGE